VAIAEDLAVISRPEASMAFHVEQHVSTSFPSERWATPRDVFGIVERPSAGLSTHQLRPDDLRLTFSSRDHHHLGNLSTAVGLSPPGAETGTTCRHQSGAYGPNGDRPISCSSGSPDRFERGLILIVARALLHDKAGFSPPTPPRFILVIVRRALAKGSFPSFWICGIVKTLRAPGHPFVVLFAVMLGFRHRARQTRTLSPTSGDWQGDSSRPGLLPLP